MSSHNSAPSHFAHGSDMSKRSADDAKLDPNSQQAAKRKRPQSCDTCRSRKIKCVRLQVDGLDASADNRCVQCRAIDAKCTFDYVPKRPGPQSSFAKTARREAEAQAQAQANTASQARSQHPAPASSHSRTTTSGFANTPSASVGGPSPHVQQNVTAGSPADDSWYRALAAQNFASGSGSGTQTRSSSWSGGTNFEAYLNNSMLAMTPSHFAGVPGASPFDFSPHNMAHISGPSPSMSVSNASSATPGSYAGSSSWHAAPRSEAGSSRSGAPLASLQQQQSQMQTQQQTHQPQPSNPSQVDQMHHSFELAAGLVGAEGRSTPLPLPIPSFSRVASPAPASAPLPQFNEPNRQQTQQQPQQQQQSQRQSQPHQESLPFGPSVSVKDRSSSAVASSSRKAKSGPSLSTMYCGPVLRPRSLEDIAPRQTFLSIVSLYFHYLWPLLPIVDRPTFSHDLLNRRDERDEAFLAFVLSLTSYTLIQCPRTVIPAPWTVYRRLHRICHLTSRRMQPRVYDPPQLLHVNTLYCDHIYLGTVGKTNAANAVLAEAVRVAYTLGLHDERKNDSSRSVAPYGLDASSFAHYRAPTANAVDRELRKRMFWVLHGSSTTIAMLQDEPALIHAIDACVDLPLAVDEEALANPGYMQRGPSVLSGFLTVTRLHQVMLELLESYRRDRRFPIDDLSVARSRIRYLANVLRRIQQAIDDMPEELRKPVYTHAPPEPIRRPGSALPALESVAAAGQHQRQAQSNHAPLLQAIGFDAATQTALGNHLSGTSPWPWPAETFTRDGLPNAEARSSNNSSATHSPRGAGGTSLPAAEGSGSALEGGQPPHQVLTPPAMTPRNNADASQASQLTMVDLVNVFRPSPPPSSTPVLSPMCTMHANIVTTESLIRFLVTEYRELVITRIHDLKLRNPAPNFNAAEDVEGEPWQEAAANMLRVFNSLPLDALASNGHSLISKIIYVVSALLNRTGTRGMGGGVTGVGFGYMSSLLATLTRLEQTRKDDSASEFEEDEAADNHARLGDDDGGSGGGGGGRRDDGGPNEHGSGSNNSRGGDGGQNNRRDDSTNRSSRHGTGTDAGEQAPPASHPHSSSHSHTGHSNNANGATNHTLTSSQLPQALLTESPSTYHRSFSPNSSCNSNSHSNPTSSAENSNASSTVNTASTTPTSEHPAGPSFYDKLVIRSHFNPTPTTNTNTNTNTNQNLHQKDLIAVAAGRTTSASPHLQATSQVGQLA